jgi:hypothetical protein
MTPAGAHFRWGDKTARRIVIFTWTVLMIISCLPVSSPATTQKPSGPPYGVGEKLVFKLKWMFIPAGEAILQVLPAGTIDGDAVSHFLLTAKSNSFVDKFFMVRDIINAWPNREVTRSVRYEKKQREGRTVRDVVVEFDWRQRVARYANYGKQRPPIPIMPGTLDPLSAFYHVRNIDLREGMEIQRPITDGKRCVIGKATVVKRETIRVGDKTYDTFLLEPELEHVGGVFEKDKDAKIKVWVTADRHRIPVRLTSKVVVGSFVGELVSAEFADLSNPAPPD